MKKLTALILVLAMSLSLAACGCDHVWLAATCDTPKTCEECGETEGEPKGHTMVEATCEEPKHCENCDLTEGEALEHVWLKATTEAPKTCENCGATEGDPIVTDSRFTTAATAELQGKWVSTLELDGDMMGMPGFVGTAAVNLYVVFGEAGDLDFSIEVAEGFVDAVIDYTVKMVYEEFAASGVEKEEADAEFAESYGTTIEEYVATEINKTDFNAMYAAMFAAAGINGVYYVEDGLLYTGDGWDELMYGETYTLSGDLLVIDSFNEALGFEQAFKRVVE